MKELREVGRWEVGRTRRCSMMNLNGWRSCSCIAELATAWWRGNCGGTKLLQSLVRKMCDTEMVI